MKKYLVLALLLCLTFAALPKILAAPSDPNEVDFEDVVDGGEYTEDIILSLDDAYSYSHNGTIIFEDKKIFDIGYHNIKVYEDNTVIQDISFTILPRLHKQLADQIIDDEVRIFTYNRGRIYLNTQEIPNGTNESKVGYHNVTIEGINGYSVSYDFTIVNSQLEFLEQTGFTYSDVNLSYDNFHAIYLEDKYLAEDLELEYAGNYKVRVIGYRGYDKTYEFTIELNNFYLQEGKVYDHYIKVQQKNAYELYIDGKKVDSIKFIQDVGYHSIKFVGLNGYEKEYFVTLQEKELDLDGLILETFNQNYSHYMGYLNGKFYTSETPVDRIGYYTYEVRGANGYKSSYEFMIHSEAHIPENETITDAINIGAGYDIIFINGSKVNQNEDVYRITDTGDYEVVLWGVNGYQESYNFSYNNLHEQSANSLYYVLGGLGAFTVVTYGFLLRRRFR